MLNTSFRQSEGSFYRGYHLTSYQHQMLMHLLEEEKPQYTVIPDWENLFIITLLFAEMMTAKHEKVVVYSNWYIKHVENVLHDVPDFYQLYEEVIRQSVEVRMTELSSVEEMKENYSISMGSGTVLDYTVDHPTRRGRYYRKQYTFDFALNLAAGASSFPYVHPEYANEQIYSVWVTNKQPPYQTSETPFSVQMPLGRNTIAAHRYFTTYKDPYPLYASLARFGPGEKMLCNYGVPSIDDYDRTPYDGRYLVPYNFYLKLPSWLSLGGTKGNEVVPGLSYLKYILLASGTALPLQEDTRVRNHALKTCGKFKLETKKSEQGDKLTYVLSEQRHAFHWVLLEPSKKLCDTLKVSGDLDQLSNEEVERRRLLLEEEAIRKKLRVSYFEPRSKDGFTIPELRLLAGERGVDLKGLKNKGEIARALLKSA